ncbi:MAG TPA: polysaccharide biosynthesis tyrosine autokinase [Crenotrichaceae bacterium]|nr:polysaccharide biosynthesis tyrosine autokinase [Crenotrichaceae bacterium]
MSILQRAIQKSLNEKLAEDKRKADGQPVTPVLPAEQFDANKSDRIDIDFNALQKLGFLNPFLPSIGLSEQYRYIKRPLLANAFPEADNGIKNRNLILVTSSLPKEGKTYTSLNLALSMAMEKGKKVLLVDGDVAVPSIARLLGISEQRPGLIDLLDGKVATINQILLHTNVPGFSVIPSGNTHSYSTELLASNMMKKLTHDLSTRYSDRIVIFDSPPVLAASQASILAQLVGQVVMVVEAEATPQTVVQDALEKVDSCDVVGMLLNKSVSGKGNGSYYYGSYYG